MSITRFAVGSGATFAKSFTRAVSTQKPPTAHTSYLQNGKVTQQSAVATRHQLRQLSTTNANSNQQAQSLDPGRTEYVKRDVRGLRKAHQVELDEFRELLRLTSHQGRGGDPLADIQSAMAIYIKLRELQVFSPGDIGSLIQGIHSTSRTALKSNMSKYISDVRLEKSAKISKQLLQFLHAVASDLKSGVSVTNQFGVMQLVTCFLTMRHAQEGYQLWKQLIDDPKSAPTLSRLLTEPKVVGAVIDLMVADNQPIEEIERVYKWSKETSGGVSDINLEHALTRAYIFYNHIPDALQSFKNLVEVYPTGDYYLARIHETFIGDCKDLDVAKSFFEEAVTKQTPYVMPVHPSATHRLMERCWNANKNVDELYNIWGAYIASLAPSARERNFNIVTYSLFTRFFEGNPELTPEAYAYLKNIIQTYSSARPMSSLFLNTLLSRVPQWNNAEVILGLIETYDIYNIEKRADTYRVILNALSNVDVEPEFVGKIWTERTSCPDTIDKYDWGALAKACSKEQRHDLFKQTWAQYGGWLSDEERRQLPPFLGRPYAGTAYAAEIIRAC